MSVLCTSTVENKLTYPTPVHVCMHVYMDDVCMNVVVRDTAIIKLLTYINIHINDFRDRPCTRICEIFELRISKSV